MQTKTRSRTGWLPTILVVALFCAIAVLGAFWITPDNTRTITGAVELPAYSTQECQPLGDGAAYYDGTLLYALRGNGTQRWSYLAGANAGFAVGEGGVATWTGAQVTLLGRDNGSTVFSVTMAKTVQSACAGSQYVAVCTGAEDDATLIILDLSGKQIDSIAKPNCTVLDYGFFNKGNLFWLMTLDTEGTVPVSSLSTYKPGKMETGSIAESDQVVYRVLFHATQIRAVGTTYMRSYDYHGTEDASSRVLVYGWYLQDIGGDGDDPLLAFVAMDETGGSQGIQDVRLLKGSVDRRIRLPYKCFAICAGSDKVYGFNGEYCVVGTLNSAKTTIYRMPVSAERVIGVTEDGKALVASMGKVYLIPLP